MFRRLKGNESGQSIVIIALAMTAIIAMAALVLDGGYAYLERRRVQNAADAAALAGGRALGKGADRATVGSAIGDYAVRNGITSLSTNLTAYFVAADNSIIDPAYPAGTGVVSSSATGIVVKAGEWHNTFFAQVIGFPMMNVSAVAQVGLESAGSAYGAVPMVLPVGVYKTDGTLYSMWDSDPSINPETGYIISNGSRGWAKFPPNDWYGGTPSEANELFDRGYPGTLTIGQWIVDKSGNSLGNTFGDDAAKWTSEHPTWILPIYDVYDGKEYHIAAFAAFEVVHAVKDGNDSHVTGVFKRIISEGSVTGGMRDDGVWAMRLKPPVTLP